ncbi:AbrB family transcriptional regulator [Brevibacillus sp. H7]|uniref:AbrB family transcriptional regulator n=1 Tax=Brevibacillus sp. H7 TaxID=3349138 RepID=UPI0037F62E8C
MLQRLLRTLLIAATGGALFTLIHSPLPWLLGPLVLTVLAIFLGCNTLWVPAWFRKAGITIVGITMGLRITQDIWQTMMDHVGLMLIATIITICFGILNAWIMHKVHKVDVTTSIFSSIPGGLVEMVNVGQNLGGNLPIISLFHSIRVVIIVLLTPFIVTLLPNQPGFSLIHSGGHVLGGIPTLCVLAIGAAGALAAARCKVPAPFLLGPLLFTTLVSLNTTFLGGTPVLSDAIVNTAQIFIGVSIGLDFRREDLIRYRRLFLSGLVHSLFLSAASILLAVFLANTTRIDLITSILATAPGGIAEMSLTALATGADPLLVTAFQLFRVLFIVTIFSFFIRSFVKNVTQKSLPKEVE